jgi:5-methylcytosine-specific restriction enzyme B
VTEVINKRNSVDLTPDEGGDELHGDGSDQRWRLEEVLQGMETATRNALVHWLAMALRHAHTQSAATWAITRRDRRLRLLVGSAVAFEIGRGRVGVGLHLPSLPTAIDAEADGGSEDFVFKHLDGAVYRRFTTERFMALADDLRQSALRFVEAAARAYRSTPYARYHARDLLDQLEEELGGTLPRPSHEIAPSYWKVSPGEGARLWEQCREGGYIAVGWDELGDLTGVDQDEFETRLEEGLRQHPKWKRGGVGQVWRFMNIPPGAKIVANEGTRRVVGIGTVTGPYQYVDDGKAFAHRLPVRWEDTRQRAVEQPSWLRTLLSLTPEVFAEIVDAPSPGDAARAAPTPKAEPAQELDFDGIMDRLREAKLQFPEELVASYLLALQAKRFVILSGISGTGKTQLAREIARAFQPATFSRPEGVAPPGDGLRMKVMPYMLEHGRWFVPRALADQLMPGGPEASLDVTVRFGAHGDERHRWVPARKQIQFRPALKQWFRDNFALDAEFDVRVESEDPPVLRFERADSEPTETAPTESRAATYAVVAVRPDWTDNRGLLGYYNPISEEYQTTPFLRLLLAAREEAERAALAGRAPLPFFAVLDEMNLARVEHYFSDFLSCLESSEPLHLHDDRDIAEGASESGEVVPMELTIPRNLFFTGTVNVDETTYMFSPKVLDRSFVLEFNDVDLDALATPPSDDETSEPSALRLSNFSGKLDIREKASSDDYQQLAALAGRALHRALASLNARLQTEHRHFGYRVANEIARFVNLTAEQAGKGPHVLWEALDVAVLSKVLPKIHGTQQEVEEILGRLLAFAVDVDSHPETREQESAWVFASGRISSKAEQGARTPRLPRSAAKLWRMLRRARIQGYVSFIE